MRARGSDNEQYATLKGQTHPCLTRSPLKPAMTAVHNSTVADYTTHEEYTVDTRDREDHTFNGIMFELETKEE